MKGHLRHLEVFSCPSKELSLSTATLLVTKRSGKNLEETNQKLCKGKNNSGKTKTKTLERQKQTQTQRPQLSWWQKDLERQKQKLWKGKRRRQQKTQRQSILLSKQGHLPLHCNSLGGKNIGKTKDSGKTKTRTFERKKQTRRRHLFFWQANSKTIFLPFSVVKSYIRSAIVPTWWRWGASSGGMRRRRWPSGCRRSRSPTWSSRLGCWWTTIIATEQSIPGHVLRRQSIALELDIK